MDHPFSFGTLLAHHRGRRDLTSVAEAVGISRNTLAAIEGGQLPTCTTLARILHHYQTDHEAPRLSRDSLGELMEALVAAGGGK